jgi:pimeloyl-ACP methyl ester carboxylesterase
VTRTTYSFGEVIAGEGLCTFLPRSWTAGDSRAVIFCHSLGGTALQGSTPDVTPGSAKFINGIAKKFPVVVTDLGGPGTCGNADAVAAIGLAKTWAETYLGADSGSALLAGASMGGWAMLNYAADNAVGAVVGVNPRISLADVRNNNRPNGWTGTSQNVPFNTDTINAAWGLAANSTGDYPAHGSSLVALPAGADPNTRTAELVGLRALYYYASDDPTMLPSILATHVANIGPPAVARSVGALGHSDAAIGAVPVDDVIDWFLAAGA